MRARRERAADVDDQPAMPTTSTAAASTGCGLWSRRTASNTMPTAPARSNTPLAWRREHLRPFEAVRVTLGRGPLRERERAQRQPEREHVRGEVYRVSDQRQAAEQEAATSSTTRNVALADSAR